MLTALRLTPGGNSTVHIYTQRINRTTQLTTLVGRLSGIRTQNGQTKINDEVAALKNYRLIGKSADRARSFEEPFCTFRKNNLVLCYILHNEELNDLYCSPNIVRVIKSRIMGWAGHVARVGEERGVYRVLVGKPEGRRPLGRPRRRWADNIRMDLQEVGCGYMVWIGLAQDRDRWRTRVSAVMNLRVL